MTSVIGTAGHVDHGKSSLVEALTGIDPDRLAEEKARQMTIDLGFAWLTLPNGEAVGIVDVPGHRDFIENMLAGVGGIDLALLVIAADEGIMPQTREHLAILDLLKIPKGLIALTKIDLVTDPGWPALVSADIRAAVAGTVLHDAPILPVSARTGEGLPQLIAALETALRGRGPRQDLARPRLPIDRVFSMSGFGTVVTGTLTGGALSVGDTVEIAPSGLQGRVRGLQSHKQAIEKALPGSRVAINLSGITKDQLKRGDVVSLPGIISGTTLVDASYRHHPDSGRALRHNDTVKFFSGAAETTAQVRLLGDETIAPGSEGWLQLRLDTPIALDRGDRYILRFPSPAQTIGGGMVIEPHPEHRWRRFKPEVLARFEALARGRPEDIALDALQGHATATIETIASMTGIAPDALRAALDGLIARGDVIALEDGWLTSRTRWEKLVGDIETILAEYHARHPLTPGMPFAEMCSRLGIKARVLDPLLMRAYGLRLVASEGSTLRLPDHLARFSAEQEQAVERLEGLIISNPTMTPSVKEATEIAGADVLHYLFAVGRLVKVSDEVLFYWETYQRMVTEVGVFIEQNSSISVAQARDLLKTSRKYATALLEHMDAIGITRRDGDAHRLKSWQSAGEQQLEDRHEADGT